MKNYSKGKKSATEPKKNSSTEELNKTVSVSNMTTSSIVEDTTVTAIKTPNPPNKETASASSVILT